MSEKTCKDCIHYTVCLLGSCIKGATGTCMNFKNSSEWVHLPCKVGDRVYQTDGIRIYESTITKIIYDTYSTAFDDRAIGNSIFLTREEAEAKIKELEDKE